MSNTLWAAFGYTAAMIQWAVSDIRKAKREAKTRIAVAKASRMVGLCSVQAPPLWSGAPAAWCEFGHGHTGTHGTLDGSKHW